MSLLVRSWWRLGALTALAALASGCLPLSSSSESDTTTAEPAATTAATTASTSTTTTTIDECAPRTGPVELPDGSDRQAVSVAVSQATFSCAETVVLASPSGVWSGAAVAVSRDAPLLVMQGSTVPETITAELERLGTETVVLVDLDGLDRSPLEGFFGGYRIEERESSYSGINLPILISPEPDRLWLVDASAGSSAAVAWTAAHAGADTFLPLVVDDLRAVSSEKRKAIQAAESAAVVTVGDLPPEMTGWQLDVVRKGEELPGGGQLLFPRRRMVALYGSPITPALGVLGEQGPEESVQRLAEVAADYDNDGIQVLPTFEIIATVASAQAGADGDYSAELSVEELRPWVEVAREEGIYVVLDLQPGRTDFLTQAQRYAELLREPHVGLALDPEWRLEPDQVHLQQIGSVDAAEVNRVSRWLAEMVRTEALPQKLFLVHQFKFSMITNRDQIETPPELATVIQMDGQGPLPTKYDSWERLVAGTEDAGWWWGWKNFYDEDSPTATPAEVLDLEPVPVFVSYQ